MAGACWQRAWGQGEREGRRRGRRRRRGIRSLKQRGWKSLSRVKRGVGRVEAWWGRGGSALWLARDRFVTVGYRTVTSPLPYRMLRYLTIFLGGSRQALLADYRRAKSILEHEGTRQEPPASLCLSLPLPASLSRLWLRSRKKTNKTGGKSVICARFRICSWNSKHLSKSMPLHTSLSMCAAYD